MVAEHIPAPAEHRPPLFAFQAGGSSRQDKRLVLGESPSIDGCMAEQAWLSASLDSIATVRR